MIMIQEHPGKTPLQYIESLTAEFAANYNEVADIVEAIKAEQAEVVAKHTKRLRRAAEQTRQVRLVLAAAIAENPDLFKNPRTIILSGIKIGLAKGRGGIEIADEAATVALIRKIYGKNAEAFLRITEVPDKKMLADMPAKELMSIGCTVKDTTDEVVIKPARAEIDKAVDALIKPEVKEVA